MKYVVYVTAKLLWKGLNFKRVNFCDYWSSSCKSNWRMLRRNPVAEHFKRIKQAADKPLTELKKGKLHGAQITHIREDTVNIDHCPITVRRVFINTSESGLLADIGWVINEGIPCCLSCHKTFTKLARRHHCRACGLLVCAECSHLAKLAGFPTFAAERVCISCVIPGAPEPVATVSSQKSWGEKVFDASPEVSEKLEQDILSKGKKATLAAPESLTIMPIPGFVIKVRRTTHDESKIFVNVFHCPTIKDKFMLLTHIPETEKEPETENNATESSEPQQKENENEQPNIMRENTGLRSFSKCKEEHTTCAPVPTKSGLPLFSDLAILPAHILSDYTTYMQNRGEGTPDTDVTATTQETAKGTEIHMTPLVYIGAPSSTVDREGRVSLLYNVLVSSAYFAETACLTSAVPITHPTSINKIIQTVNAAHSESLCECTFSLPRIRKGYMCAHNEELKSDIYTRSDCSVMHVPEEKITTTRYMRFGSICSDGSVQTFVSTAENYPPRTTTAPPASPASSPGNDNIPGVGVKSNGYSMLPRGKSAQFVHTPAQMMHNDWYSPRIVKAPQTSSSSRPQSTPNLNVLNAKLIVGGRSSSKKAFLSALDITEEMLVFRHAKALTWKKSEELKAQACRWPQILVGYQIVMPYTKEDAKTKLSPIIDQSLVYVVMEARKNASFQTEYRVSNSANISNSMWTRLQRSAVKSGAEFRVICRVANA